MAKEIFVHNSIDLQDHQLIKLCESDLPMGQMKVQDRKVVASVMTCGVSRSLGTPRRTRPMLDC